MLSKTKKYNKSDKNTSDTQKIQKYLSGFDPKNTKIMKVIITKFGTGISHNELISISNIIAENTEIKMDRLIKRHKGVLIKWLDDNYDVAYPIIEKMELWDESYRRITLHREIQESIKNKKNI